MAAIVAVLKLRLPIAYSLMFLIPLLEINPKMRVMDKNPIKIGYILFTGAPQTYKYI